MLERDGAAEAHVDLRAVEAPEPAAAEALDEPLNELGEYGAPPRLASLPRVAINWGACEPWGSSLAIYAIDLLRAARGGLQAG